jgi:hypothetical protein
MAIQPSALCTFALLHLCTFARLHGCTFAGEEMRWIWFAEVQVEVESAGQCGERVSGRSRRLEIGVWRVGESEGRRVENDKRWHCGESYEDGVGPGFGQMARGRGGRIRITHSELDVIPDLQNRSRLSKSDPTSKISKIPEISRGWEFRSSPFPLAPSPSVSTSPSPSPLHAAGARSGPSPIFRFGSFPRYSRHSMPGWIAGNPSGMVSSGSGSGSGSGLTSPGGGGGNGRRGGSMPEEELRG